MKKRFFRLAAAAALAEQSAPQDKGAAGEGRYARHVDLQLN
jgi:hypothetical protein